MTRLTRRHLIQGAALGATAGIAGIPWPAAAQAARGGVLVIGTTQRARHLNAAVQSGIATMSPAAQLFASPLRMSADFKPQPFLAERWELSPDNRSVRLHLRKDAVFHDGKPITAEDVRFSLETLRDNHPFKSMYAPLNAVTIDDPHTAVVRLSEPHPALLLAMSTSLTPVLPRHIFGDGTDVKVHPRNTSPVGSGPFRLVEFKPGEVIVMDRFERFFLKDQPKLDRIIIREFKDPASLLLAFERGEVDIYSGLVDPRDIARARKVPNATVTGSSAPALGSLVWLAFNTRSPKLADKRVRQAIHYALDKKAIVETMLGGVPRRSTGPIASGSPFYTPKVEHYDLDLAKAAQLLDAAGLKPGANGVRLTVDVDSVPGVPDMKVIQEYMKPALAKVGIEVTVRTSPDFPTWARRVSTMQFEMTIDSVWNWGDPVIGVHRTWLSSNIRPGVIWSNTQSYANPKVDELLAAAGREMDAKKRRALYETFQRIVVDDCPVAFLIEANYHQGVQGRVKSPPAGIWGVNDALVDTWIARG
ncbi:MAG: ABC transporter substrate-binding protein [Betaproteobacteria bacterium]|nr:ABC transporter substrate-binding protein [Betaproteobacteria bacterium]